MAASQRACSSDAASASQRSVVGRRFHLLPTAATLKLLAPRSEEALFGYTYSAHRPNQSAAAGLQAWQHTHFCAFQPVLIQALARHPACTNEPADAAICIVAAPPGGRCQDWAALCPRHTTLAHNVVREVGLFEKQS